MSLVTYNGTQFDYLNPTPEMIDIDDIFRSLPRLNRFVGHSSRAYSVGEHTLMCLIMADLLGYSPREKLLVFVHDFTEAYVSDCPAPLKRLIPDFSKIEAKVEDVIYKRIGIEPPTEEEHKKVKRIDLSMLVVEMRDLTVHEWESFINEHVYEDILDNPYLWLDKNNFSENQIRDLLRTCYTLLLERVKEEDSNA
jgi:uncharacterized protein